MINPMSSENLYKKKEKSSEIVFYPRSTTRSPLSKGTFLDEHITIGFRY